MPLPLAALASVALASSPHCITAYGRTACGYACEAAYGQVACASTPMGRCIAAYGQVTCGDPSPQALQWYGAATPRVECLSAYGQVACGYGCEAAYGQLACARFPGGRCEAAWGTLRCVEPRLPEEPLGVPGWGHRSHRRQRVFEGEERSHWGRPHGHDRRHCQHFH